MGKCDIPAGDGNFANLFYSVVYIQSYLTHRKKKDYERGKEEAVMLGGGGGLTQLRRQQIKRGVLPV